MADHALAGRNGLGELVLERVPHFLLGDRGVFALRLTAVAEQGIRAGVKRVTIIGVHHMAGGTAAGAKIAGVVVGP